MSRRILIVAYYFPPLGGIGSLRLLGFARHLPEFGWEPTVIAPANGAYHRDPTLVFPEERVVRPRSLELSRWGKRLTAAGGSDTVAARPGRAGAGLRELARRHVYFPDAQVGWYPGARLIGGGLVAGKRRRPGSADPPGFDAILSSSFPITAHLIARSLHRRSGIPWVADFRDPWSAAMADHDPRRPRATALERALAQEAAAVIMPSPTWAAEHERRWGRQISVVPNGYEAWVGDALRPTREDGFVLAHLGTHYPGQQDLSTLWDAAARLRAAGSDVRVRFVGELPAVVAADLRRRGLEPEATGFLSHSEAALQIASASVLVAAGPSRDRPAQRGWIPAKLFDYLATDRPIVYVSARPNDGASLLDDQSGAHVVAPGDTDAALAALRAAQDTPTVVRDTSPFSRRERTRTLALALGQLSSAPVPTNSASPAGEGFHS
jgi:glycosyltransferase involved in cell wall biosynthesis